MNDSSISVSLTQRFLWSGFWLLVCLGFAVMSQAQTPAGNRVLTGAFVDRDWSDANPCGDKVTSNEEWNDNKQWYGNVYPYFGKIFPEIFRPDGSKNWYGNWQAEIARIKSQGRVPYINLEFHGELQRHDNNECWHLGGTGSGGNDRVTHNIIKEILDGKHNDIIDNIAWGLKGEGVPVVIDLFHEANGGWYDWSPCKHTGETWARFRSAYQYVVNRFRAVGATNVKFGQSVWPSSGCWTDAGPWGTGAVVADMVVPGYMDWIGIDIYGSGSVGVFTDLLDPWYNALAGTGLPIVIGEMAVSPGPNKANWMTSFANALTSGRYPAVKAFNWFDINKPGEADWRISEGGNGPLFDRLMSHPAFVGSFGTYQLKSKANGQCLDITNNATADSAKVQTYGCNGSAAQTFTFNDLGNYAMELRALNSGKCLDVAGGSSADGAQIQQYACNASAAQVWKMRIIDWATLEVELTATNSNKCLDVDAGAAKVQQWWCNSGVSQRFFLGRFTSSSSSSSSSSSNSQAPLATVQAESYGYMSGVQTETTSDTGGGLNLGYIDTGDWMSYDTTSITLPATGSYIIEFRVASATGGGVLGFEESGGTPSYALVAIPNTGGWQNWTTVRTTVTLTAGVHKFGIKANVGGWNLNWFRITRQ
jgi:hypothetical protein